MTRPSRAAGGLEGDPGDALDLVAGVDAGVQRRVRLAPLLAEVDAAGELAHDEDVGALDDLGAQRARVDERRARADGPEVGKEAEALAQTEEALLRAGLVRVGRVPLRAPNRAEQHGVGITASLEDSVGERDPVRIDRGSADKMLLVGEVPDGVEDLYRSRNDLGADPVAGQERDVPGGAHAVAEMLRRM